MPYRTVDAHLSDRQKCVATGVVPHETLVAVLELLQWRHGIQGEQGLAQPLCSLLKRLLAVATAAPRLASEAAEPEAVEAALRGGQHAAEAAFLAQLVLAGLRALSERCDAEGLVQVSFLLETLSSPVQCMPCAGHMMACS